MDKVPEAADVALRGDVAAPSGAAPAVDEALKTLAARTAPVEAEPRARLLRGLPAALQSRWAAAAVLVLAVLAGGRLLQGTAAGTSLNARLYAVAHAFAQVWRGLPGNLCWVGMRPVLLSRVGARAACGGRAPSANDIPGCRPGWCGASAVFDARSGCQLPAAACWGWERL